MKKEITPRKSARNLTLRTLEDIVIKGIVGANTAKDTAKYGAIGANSAEDVLNGEEIKKVKEGKYQELSNKYKELGIAGEPTQPSNSDISYEMIKRLENVMKNSYLEDLAEGVNKIAPELKFELPEKLKNYVPAELMQKAAEEKDGELIINPKKLNEDEQVAFGVYNQLREAYKLTAAKDVMDSNYLGDVKGYLDGVMEKYNPTIKMQPQEDLALAA